MPCMYWDLEKSQTDRQRLFCEVEDMANIAPFLVMNYIKRKEKEDKERKKRYQEDMERMSKIPENVLCSRSKIKLSDIGYSYNDLPEDVKELIEYGIIELEA